MADIDPPRPSPTSLRALPPSIWALGLGSMFMDVSSELIHSLLPIFMATVLGASMVSIGLVEGLAEATTAITKMFSGALSDAWGKRKPLVVLGYGLAAITKPVFPLATSMGWIFAARFVDRVGKGIRGAPRDALIADITPRALRGAAYGLRQALDSVGAVIGPCLAIAFMSWFANDLAAVMWIAVVPACLAVGLLIVAVREPDGAPSTDAAGPAFTLAGTRRLTSRYWWIVLLGAVFTLARFSEAFLVLRAQTVGLGIGYAPLVMVMMNIVYSVAAYPAGVAADRFGARPLLLAGLAVAVVADLLLAAATSAWHVCGGAMVWGLHMAATQGLLAKLVADAAPAHLRGTAFGIFNLITGIALLAASVVAGLLWQRLGPPATFIAGAAFAATAGIGIMAFRPR